MRALWMLSLVITTQGAEPEPIDIVDPVEATSFDVLDDPNGYAVGYIAARTGTTFEEATAI